jgi:hypothetical protein
MRYENTARNVSGVHLSALVYPEVTVSTRGHRLEPKYQAAVT